jgi:hypothetical protein
VRIADLTCWDGSKTSPPALDNPTIGRKFARIWKHAQSQHARLEIEFDHFPLEELVKSQSHVIGWHSGRIGHRVDPPLP